MPRLSKSPKLYQERRLPDDRQTLRGPGPRSDFDNNLARALPLLPPLPLPEMLRTEGDGPPLDAGQTPPWPHGSEEIV